MKYPLFLFSPENDWIKIVNYLQKVNFEAILIVCDSNSNNLSQGMRKALTFGKSYLSNAPFLRNSIGVFKRSKSDFSSKGNEKNLDKVVLTTITFGKDPRTSV